MRFFVAPKTPRQKTAKGVGLVTVNDDAQAHASLIRQIEEVAADAVPPAVVEPLGGWRLRFNHGVKRRPNSVLANFDDGALTLGEKFDRVEAFYAKYGFGARYQLCPASQPEDLGARLLERGYIRVPESVSVRTLELAGHATTVPDDLILSPAPSDTWLSLYCEIEGLHGEKRAAFSEMVARFPGTSCFALTHDQNGQAAGVGVGVLHGGLLGLFNIATHPSARRQGLAAKVVHGLCAWAADQGVARAYLQVAGENSGAQALYERLGFKTLYAYFYLEQP